MSNKEETKEETKEPEKAKFSFTEKDLTPIDIMSIGNYTPPKSKDELYIWLQAAMSIELSTLPIYCQAWFSIKYDALSDPTHKSPLYPPWRSFKTIVMQEMLHMSTVSNLVLSIFGNENSTYPVKCAFDIVYGDGQHLPQQVRPDLTVELNRYTPEQLFIFSQIECATQLTTPEKGIANYIPTSGNSIDVVFDKESEYDTIGEFYNALVKGIEDLASNGEIEFNTDDSNLQVAHLINYATDYGFPDFTKHVPIKNVDDAKYLINMIVEQGEGSPNSNWLSGITFEDDSAKSHYIRFVELGVGRKIKSVLPSKTQPKDTSQIAYTFTYEEGNPLYIGDTSDNLYQQSNFANPDTQTGSGSFQETYTGMLTSLQATLNDPKTGTGIPGAMLNLQSGFNTAMSANTYPTWRPAGLDPPPSVFDISRKARVLFLKKKRGHNFYQQNLKILRAGTKAVNGIYKNTAYDVLPKAIRDIDTKAKRETGIIGYQHILSGSGTEYYITVSTATSKDVTTSTPTLSVYQLTLKDKSVTLLYTVASKYGVLPDRKAFTYKNNEKGDKTSNPRVVLHINNYIEPSLLVNAFSGVWYGDKGIDTMFIMNQDDPIDGPLGGNINKGFATSYNETVEYVPLSFGVLNPRSLSMKNPKGDPETAEVIYGVRLVRRVLSTLPDNDNTKDNPFKSGGTIHEETGYILFCYVGGILVRIAKSLAIPRVISVLANDDTPIITYLNGNLVIRTNLKAKATSETNLIWTVSNGTFPDHYGKVTEFEQAISLTYDENKPNESSLMYLQFTPITFNNQNTPHTNKNFLTKQS